MKNGKIQNQSRKCANGLLHKKYTVGYLYIKLEGNSFFPYIYYLFLSLYLQENTFSFLIP
jgi:hypothetical protein